MSEFVQHISHRSFPASSLEGGVDALAWHSIFAIILVQYKCMINMEAWWARSGAGFWLKGSESDSHALLL